MKTVFLRVLEAEDKSGALLEAVREPERARGQQRFDVDPRSFASVPRSPFAYWVSERLRRLFSELPPFEAEGRAAKQGLATADDFRFVRMWWEVPARQVGSKWFPYAKGGAFSPIYADVYLVVNWNRAGEEIKGNLNEHGGIRSNVWMLRDTADNYFFRPGLTYPARPHSRGWFSCIPAGCVFSHNGPMVFMPDAELMALSGLLNGTAFHSLVQVQMARGHGGSVQSLTYEVGMIAITPLPRLTNVDRNALARLSLRAWSLKRSQDSRVETSHAFTHPGLLQTSGKDLGACLAEWSERARTVDTELSGIQAEIDERCFALYGIDEVDRRTITEGFGTPASDEASDVAGDADDDDAEENAEDSAPSADATSLAADLVSWAVGVAFGRFDVRLAIGARSMPAVPGPFDALPACSPGMLIGGDGLPLARPPAGYPLTFPEGGVLVDDFGHAQDLTAAVRAVFDVIFGADADRWWNDVAALLDPKGHDLRVWLADSFFEHCLKRHSKSRRKAPIIWQLGTPSGRYSVWLYAQRVTHDTFFQLQNEVVGPKLAHEERQLTGLIQNAGGSPSARERNEISAQEAIVEELRVMLDEIRRVALLWNPNLDDGVVLTIGPLWRLVPQCKPWQKELKAKWDELAAGKYDWAHLAMHLWPERVVPKCAADRSLAIAHGFEDIFWVEGADGKWRQRPVPVHSVDEVVRERTSPAVKAALGSLFDAPVITAGARRSGAASAATGGTT